MKETLPATFRGFARRVFRALLALPGVSFSVRKVIGGRGPFKLDGCFMFSDFSRWGSGKNAGFSMGLAELAPGSTLLDIGAHVGLFALPAAAVTGPSGKVVAFEPGPRNAQLLRRHVALNGLLHVEVVEALVGDKESAAVPFHVAKMDSGLNSLVMPKPDGFVRIEIPMTTIDEFCKAKGLAPDFIKLDVEGSELAALSGAREVLENHRPIILLSVHPWHLKQLGSSVEELGQFLQAQHYQAFDHEGRPVAHLSGEEYLVKPQEMESVSA